MYVLECPHCHARLKASKPMVNARVKCSKCGEVFIGSTIEQVSKPKRPAPAAERIELARPAYKRKYSPRVILALVGLSVGVAGAFGLGAWGIYLAYHPKVIVRERQTGKVIESKRLSQEEAEEKVKEVLSAPQQYQGAEPVPVRGRPVDRKVPGKDESSATHKPSIPLGDEKIRSSWSIVYADISNRYYICGMLASSYSTALAEATVTAYIDATVGPSKTYPFVPPEGEIRFCLPLGQKKVDQGEVKIVVRGKPADKETVVLSIDSDEMERDTEGTKVIWTGTLRNTSGVPVKDVRVYCNFFDDDGIEVSGGTRVGKVTTGRTIGIGKVADFRVELDVVGAEVYKTIVARAAGKRY